MPTYKVFNFSDPNLDYNEVLQETQLMYSDLTSQSKGCCHSRAIEDVLCEVDKLLQAASIDSDNDDDIRFQNDVKVAYKLLYAIVNN